MKVMMDRALRLGLLPLSLCVFAVPACADTEGDLDALEFRQGDADYPPGEPPTRLYTPSEPQAGDGGGDGGGGGGDGGGDGGGGDAGGGDDGGQGGGGGKKDDDDWPPPDDIGPEDLTWIFLDGGLYDATGEKILQVTNGVFYDADGAPRCIIDGNELTEFTRVRSFDAPGEVIFTVRGPFVFDGEVTFPKPHNFKKKWGKHWKKKFKKAKKKLKEQILFSYFLNYVYDGFFVGGDILFIADQNLMIQTRKRKFMFASAIAGECGAPGFTDPDDVP